MRIWIRNTALFLAIICGVGHQGNLWICDLRINHYKFANLRFVDHNTPQKFADLRLRNELKKLRICDLRTNQKICMPTFA
jgi:hypothetical protein